MVALNWTILKFRLGLVFEPVATEIPLLDPPLQIDPHSLFAEVTGPVGWEEVEGFYPTDKTVVRPEQTKLIREELGQPTILTGLAFRNVVAAMEEAFGYPGHDALLNHRRLLLAIHVYASSFFETGGPARFLTLMTALEALAEPALRPEQLRECVADYMNQLQSRRAELIAACGQQEFDSLVGSIRNLSQRSIAQRIKSLLQITLADTPEFELVARFGEIYGIRCQLVHQGISDQNEIRIATSFLEPLVAAVLRYLLLRTVKRKPL
jgi:hypothetical protein